MDWADDIAYSTHDLEDGIKAGMISESRINSRIENSIKAEIGEGWDQAT
jgi:dGTPase